MCNPNLLLGILQELYKIHLQITIFVYLCFTFALMLSVQTRSFDFILMHDDSFLIEKSYKKRSNIIELLKY